MELNEQIELIETLTTDDLPGEVAERDSVIARLWAKVEAFSASKQVAFKQVQWEATHKITVNYNPTIKPFHKVCWRGETFYIQDLIPTPDKRYHVLTVGRVERNG